MMRSLLFIPADSERKMEKALGCGADALILDLEDSVATAAKATARQRAAAFLEHAGLAPERPRLIVRVNPLDSDNIELDLAAIVPMQPDLILLPKAVGGQAVAHLDAKLTVHEAQAGLPEGCVGLLALAIETGPALFAAGSFANASPRLAGLTWGAEDLAADLGAQASRHADGSLIEPCRLARSLCLAGAATAQVPAYETVYARLGDTDGLAAIATQAMFDGFAGMLAIHPGQVATINEAFTPSPAAIGEAQEIAAVFAAAPDAGVVSLHGRMIDMPHLKRAQRVLALARQAEDSMRDHGR
ncbi:MAG TPA: CoA ester lyase [Xanthobacteraceae bacterium]|nr:CoA ester lyase [Xanthobacteraceae bacterium]